PYFNGWATAYVYVLIICFEVIVLAASYRIESPAPRPGEVAWRRNEALPGIALLAALPFAGAIGTRNNIFLNALLELGGWFALIVALGLLSEDRRGGGVALFLCVLRAACLGPAQIFYGMVWKPSLLAAPLLEQTVALQQPASVAGLKVDPATAAFITE